MDYLIYHTFSNYIFLNSKMYFTLFNIEYIVKLCNLKYVFEFYEEKFFGKKSYGLLRRVDPMKPAASQTFLELK